MRRTPIKWLPDTLMKPYKYDGHTITNRYDDFYRRGR